ncbi:hypothetical protein [Methylococcus mesophilus]|uniref:hypothetical protein n=1 Tax=Methylococcus mesophilus TaxID=2993564 RepID=UPI00224B86F4|nr:hypothetical protein [Methylococcus mesophilus]UZR29065.1 hypothetical protein OOT43_00130 [Methylococcus mesophilus]
MPAEHVQPMTVEKALEMTDFWTGGLIFAPGMEGWRIVCATLAAEVRRLRAAEAEPDSRYARTTDCADGGDE